MVTVSKENMNLLPLSFYSSFFVIEADYEYGIGATFWKVS